MGGKIMKNYEELMKEIKKGVEELQNCLGAEKDFTEDEIKVSSKYLN